MNDPWDVKCVRQAGQYVSCMKLNGVPLLPPVLSKECRKEMQYYKLLAKEVEKRISLLQPYVLDTDSEPEEKSNAPELPECKQTYNISQEILNDNFDKVICPKATEILKKSFITSQKSSPTSDIDQETTIVESLQLDNETSRSCSPKLIIDLSLSINQARKNVMDTVQRDACLPPQVDLPERDYNCTRKVTQKIITEKEIITEVETQRNNKEKRIQEVTNVKYGHIKNNFIDPFPELSSSHDGPSSLSSKSFTGSLNDLHSESGKDMHASKLNRQRSYTLLNPSPQLLAHLEVQAMNTGMEMTSISMSESLSNISCPNKKRRSWDLESAKVKWSSMALELKHTNVAHNLKKNPSNKSFIKSPPKKLLTQPLPSKAKLQTVLPDKRRNPAPKPTTKTDPLPKSEPLHKSETPKSEPYAKKRMCVSPPRNVSRSIRKDPTSSKVSPKSEQTPKNPSSLISESDDPASRVRELYEKIQNQQLIQMASLVEKQKREQLLLQQVFEEQNNLLFKQLKTICPKSPIEIKEAWSDKHPESDRGPVSLSQLINYKSPERSNYDSPVSATLTDTNNCINYCDNVLKKSRDITGSIKKQPNKSHSQNGTKIVSPRTKPDGSRTRTHSPSSAKNTPTSRKLNYDSASTDHENEPMLTDRTNDTMADLNVTFPSDHSDDYSYRNNNNLLANSVTSQLCSNEIKTFRGHSPTSSSLHSRSTDDAIRNMERTIHNSIKATNSRVSRPKFNIQPTPQGQAAATKIVAHAKGYLVRRLMRTDRVQATVQTIKDALLCALQLHQDREGIRGADVDLHRRLIQQITAACYSLHDTFVASTAAERCAMIAADRNRKRSLAARQNSVTFRQTSNSSEDTTLEVGSAFSQAFSKNRDVMSQSHSGAFPARNKRASSSTSLMTQSNYETFSGEKRSTVSVSRCVSSPHSRPWR